MELSDYIRNRNNKMNPNSVIKFYKQAIFNNERWLKSTTGEEKQRIETFLDRAYDELEHAKNRLSAM